MKPEYFFNTASLYKKIMSLVFKQPDIHSELAVVNTVQGFPIQIRNKDAVGRAIAKFQLYDLVVSETLLRLTEADSICVDGGSNIGFMALLMADKAKNGKVYAFEANPYISKILKYNAHTLNQFDNISCFDIALSNENEELNFKINNLNSGESKIISTADFDIKVMGRRLDSLIDQNIKIFKLDVEGYELEVLKGAENLLDKKKIENILYEDHVGYPSKVSQYLERKGYHIFKINKGFWQPLLQSPTVTQKILYEPPNYIATHNPFSLKKTMARKGWRIYSK